MTGHQMSRRSESRRVGEVAGNATAECAAVCCCVPCAVMDMVVLATYKVPAGLLKKALLKREKKQLQRQKQKKSNNNNKKKNNDEALLDDGPATAVRNDVGPRPTLEDHLAEEIVEDSKMQDDDMWAQFNGAGFWRSTSQRHQPHLETHQ